MAITVKYYVKLIGSNGDIRQVTVKSQPIDEGSVAADVAMAELNANLFRAAVAAVTDANIQAWGFIYEGGGALGGIPEEALLYVDAVLSLDISNGGPLKKATFSLPAPAAAVFLDTSGPNEDVVDINDIGIQALALWLQTYGTVSDGEVPEGLLSGYRRSRGRRLA